MLFQNSHIQCVYFRRQGEPLFATVEIKNKYSSNKGGCETIHEADTELLVLTADYTTLHSLSREGRCGIAEKFKTLICMSLPNKSYYCLIPRSIECLSQFSAIPHLTRRSILCKNKQPFRLLVYANMSMKLLCYRSTKTHRNSLTTMFRYRNQSQER